MRVTQEQREAWLRNTADSPFNRWLDEKVRDRHGSLDLERLHSLAESYGVRKRAAYAHLNPGQQRMNIGNALRRVVPEQDYLRSQVPPSLKERSLEGPLLRPLSPIMADDRPPLVRQATVRNLLKLHAQIMDELRDRKIVRTSNNPTGDYAETLFARAFGWRLAENSASAYDAETDAGIRYQIKARRLTNANGSRQLSALRNIDGRGFHFLAALLFDASYEVLRAAIVPHDVVAARSTYRKHTNASIFMLTDDVWKIDGVQDVTRELRAAATPPPPAPHPGRSSGSG